MSLIIVNILFIICTYLITGEINSIIYHDLCVQLEKLGYQLKEKYKDDYKEVLEEYLTTNNLELIFKYLSILPVVNVIYSAYKSQIYEEQKEYIIKDLDEMNSLEVVRITNKDVVEDNRKNEYMVNDIKPKIKIKKRSFK